MQTSVTLFKTAKSRSGPDRLTLHDRYLEILKHLSIYDRREWIFTRKFYSEIKTTFFILYFCLKFWIWWHLLWSVSNELCSSRTYYNTRVTYIFNCIEYFVTFVWNCLIFLSTLINTTELTNCEEQKSLHDF